MHQGSYILDFTVLLPSVNVSYAASYGNISSSEELQDLHTLHLRLGHLHCDMIKRMATNGSMTVIKIKNIEPPSICSSYAFGKSHRASFPRNITRTRVSSPGMLLHSNICRPMNVPSHGGSLYYILLQDDCTRYRLVFCIP